MSQLLLPDGDRQTAESPYDVGFRHALTGKSFHNQNIPRKFRKEYARGYARGAARRARLDREES